MCQQIILHGSTKNKLYLLQAPEYMIDFQCFEFLPLQVVIFDELCNALTTSRYEFKRSIIYKPPAFL